ncbi:UPF0223 family protein [Bacillus seohaeanensis]|jgi:uncharacterized protein YktA (UPF0223 family)|uniref:UPF0223 protein ACFSUL_03830 n=1 Tax=Bacillus seohaeanensis TaxID=284580 RepID=A0ABW5RP32_9BACI
MEYQYPFDLDWSTEEVIDVVAFFQGIEKAYEKGISREDLMAVYKRFKEIVPGKAEEKKIFKEFQESSGYSSYHVIKEMKKSESNSHIKMN